MAEAQTSTTPWSRFRAFDSNPVWVKDLRQAARNPLVTGLLVLFLFGFLLACIGVVMTRENSGGTSYAGQPVFGIIGGVTTGVCSLFIPIYFFVRTMMEKATINSDLLYITQMTPQQIIRGKFLSAAYLILLFYSTAFPFLVFSYFLRGVDLKTILLSAAFSYTANLLVALMAITWALLPWGTAAKIISAILCGYFFPTFLPVFIGFGLFRGMSMGAPTFDGNLWLLATVYLFNFALLAGMLYQWTVALVTTPSANKALPVRRYFTVLSLLVLLQFFAFAWAGDREELALGGMWVVAGCIISGFFFCIGFRDLPITDRIRREIPEGGIARAFSFLFYNGKYPGLLWLAGLWFLILLIFMVFTAAWKVAKAVDFLTWGAEMSMLYVGTSAQVLYGLGYAMLANSIAKMITQDNHHRFAPLFFLLLVFVPPLLLALASIGHSFPEHVPFIVFTVFANDDFHVIHLIWSIILVAGCHAGNQRWVTWHVRRFHPLPPEEDTLANAEDE